MAKSNGDSLQEHLIAEYGFKASDPVFMKMMSDIRLFTEADRKQHELDLLDKLIAQEWSFGEGDDAMAVPTRYIKAERERLKS